MKFGLLVTSLSLLLVGCTPGILPANLVPGDKTGQGSSTQPGDGTGSDAAPGSGNPGLGLNTLGVVAVDVSTHSFEVWPDTVAAQLNSFGGYAGWKFQPIYEPVPADAQSIRYYKQVSDTTYEAQFVPGLATHVQYRAHGEGEVPNVTAKLGEAPASKVMWDGYINKLICYVPKTAAGNLVLEAAGDKTILGMSAGMGTYSPLTTQTLTRHTNPAQPPNETQYAIQKIATMTLDFTAQEPDGTPVSGLTRDYLTVSLYRNDTNPWGVGIQKSSITLNETATGSYRLRATVYSAPETVGTTQVLVQVTNKPDSFSANFYRR